MTDPIILEPIGVLHSPYDAKFAVPRQPNLVAEGKGILQLLPPYNAPEAIRGLDQFSHLWLIFQFNQVCDPHWHATVRPPRLGGNTRLGVFATRATHRPNRLGLSKVRLEKIELIKGEVKLHLGSVDLVNGTPILDIKPYIAYADSEPMAQSGFAQEKPLELLEVEFAPTALQVVESADNFAKFGIQDPVQFIRDVIAQDPRPAYQQGKLSERVYGMSLAGYNIRWQISPNNPYRAEVIDIKGELSNHSTL